MARKRVYFHIDEVARDSVVAANLKIILAQRGVDLIYGNRTQTYRLWRACPFDALILPHLSFIEDYKIDPSAPLPPIIALPTEGLVTSPLLKFFGRQYFAGDKRWAQKIAAFCFWGDEQIASLDADAPELRSRCHIVGHPRFDRRCIRGPRPAKAADDGRVRIGLMSRFSLINPHDGRSGLATIHDARRSQDLRMQRASTWADIEDRFYTNIADLRVLLDFVDRIDPALHDVRVRVHPREDRTKWQELISSRRLPITVAPWDQPFAHWLGEVDWIIAPPSTGFYDIFYQRKPVVCLHRIAKNRAAHVIPNTDDTMPILDYTLQPESLEELLALVSKKPGGPMELPAGLTDALRRDADYPACENSLDRLADVCELVLEQNAFNYSPISRLVFDMWCTRDILRTVGMIDQGSYFRLTRARRRWIDQLAVRSELPPPAGGGAYTARSDAMADTR